MSLGKRSVYRLFSTRQSCSLDHNRTSMGPIWGQCGTVHESELLDLQYEVYPREQAHHPDRPWHQISIYFPGYLIPRLNKARRIEYIKVHENQGIKDLRMLYNINFQAWELPFADSREVGGKFSSDAGTMGQRA